jgi:hypothetical protein
MAKAEYKVIQGNNANQLSVELNVLGQSGWKPILMTTTHAPVTPTGQGHLVITVILEHVPGT